MAANYAYTAYIWPPFFTALLLVGLAIYSGQRRNVPGALPFMIGCLFSAMWAAGWVMEYAALDMATKIGWVKFEGVVQLPIIIAITCFFLEYAWPGRWLTRRNLALMSIPALFMALLMPTNDLHHLAWISLEPGRIVSRHPAPLVWAGIGYAYGLAALSIAVLAWLFRHSPQHRWPVVIMLTGLVVGRSVYLLDRLGVFHSDLPLGMFGMAVEFLMYTIALFGFRIFDPITLARQSVVAQMSDGMLVLDNQGRLDSLNPAAQTILGAPEKQLLGRSIDDLLPGQAGAREDVQPGQVEICLPGGPGARFYQMEISALSDWRGSPVGRLVMLHDVTEQKQAQAQIIAGQRALAILKEREQLARELHDSIGQVLGYTGFQLEAVQVHVSAGQAALEAGQPAQAGKPLEQAQSQLARLSNIVAEAHADLREVILNLRLAPSEQHEFFATLQQYMHGFSQNYGIQAELTLGPGTGQASFEMGMQLQLFRIIQEALSNARKHAGASRVQVVFEKQDARLLIRIEDNGQGFDPAQVSSAGGRHLGLRFMRERAEAIGGSLQVHTAPGAGTRVELDLPVEMSGMERADENPDR